MSDPHAAPTTTTADAKNGVLGDVDNPASLLMVFVAVIGLSLANVGLSIESESWGLHKYILVMQLLIGTIQAGLVAYYFMHLRHGDRVVILTALASIFWMGILFVLFMADYMTRHMVVNN